MRSKEDAQDYRYFPDPDLVPIEISDEWMDKVREAQPEFRDEKKVRYKEEYDLSDYDIDIITGSKHLADIFEATIALGSEPKEVSNWLMGETIRLVNESEMDIDDVSFKPEHLAKLIEMIKNNEINRSVGKEVFEKVFKEDIDPAAYVEEHGLKSMNDEGALKATIEEIVANNPKPIDISKVININAILNRFLPFYQNTAHHVLQSGTDITGNTDYSQCSTRSITGSNIHCHQTTQKTDQNSDT